ncbi:hypothetical protein D7Y22_03595 [Stenotrophomonas maltophilia]|uniref:hypothetical protein n=1 Tax=Stenotrophomonas maltophilia TaxID=40324 RepID=UPI0015DE088E|nr:hypothetical protein [Stenotrophomonas maltophilia]MBA0420045.1 hypothetical protein [Stenotrophomonas maltophilia]
MPVQATSENLTAALELADASSRGARVERIEWLAQHYFHPGAVMGELAVLHMLEEARLCFISGHFVGALLLATSFVEQTLSEELENVMSPQERRTFELMIKSGRKILPLPNDLFDRTDRLRLLRNPFTHRKAPDHPEAFGTRFLATKAHPATILEADAKLAMEVMYEWFRRTLRSA